MRIKEFAASNPDVLERYGMGLAPGLDDNSALLRLALDRSIASTELPAPPGEVQVGQPQVMPTVQNATAPTRKSATAAPKQAPATEWYNTTENPNLGPLPPRDASAGEKAAAPQGGGGLGLLDLIATLVGGGAVAKALSGPSDANARGRGAGAGAPNQLPTSRALPGPPTGQLALPPPAIALPDQSQPQAPQRPTQSPEEIARLRAEVDAENAALKQSETEQARQLQEQMRIKRNQSNTSKTLKAGARAVRGR